MGRDGFKQLARTKLIYSIEHGNSLAVFISQCHHYDGCVVYIRRPSKHSLKTHRLAVVGHRPSKLVGGSAGSSMLVVEIGNPEVVLITERQSRS